MLKVRDIRALRIVAAALLVVLSACASNPSKPPKIKTLESRWSVVLDARTGVIDLNFPDPNCHPEDAAIADESGGWYIAGYSYPAPYSSPQPCLARLRSDGTPDATFSPQLSKDQFVDSLVFNRGVLYAGVEGWGVLALDAQTGDVLWARKASYGVSLAIGRGVLYATGFGRFGLAALDPRTGATKPLNVRLSWVDGFVAHVGAVAFGNGVLYIAGEFDHVGGEARPVGIAAIDPRSGHPTLWSPKQGSRPETEIGRVTQILATHGQVLVGGWDGFVVYSARTARNLPWRKGISSTDGGAIASGFTLSGDTVYLFAGNDKNSGFDHAGGLPVNNLTAIRLPSGEFLNWRPFIAPCQKIYTVAVSSGKVLVGGSFSNSSTLARVNPPASC